MTRPRPHLSVEALTVGLLFQLIERGELGLPNFQRRYEWPVTDVSAFLSTVIGGLPSGNLMVADNDAIKVSLRPLEGAPELHGAASSIQVLLDGQQRLTALYRAVREIGPEQYYVDFRALSDGADVLQDDVVFSVSKRQSLESLHAGQRGEGLVPVSALFNPSSFYSWLSSIRGSTNVFGSIDFGKIFSEVIQPIERYEIPITRIGGDVNLSTVAQIFERTNKWGQKLDAFDLLVARLQGGGWELRGAWSDAQSDFPAIRRVLGDSGIAPLTAISLLTFRDVRRNAVLSLSSRQVVTMWDDVVAATNDACLLLLQEGFRQHDLVPYDSITVALIAGLLSGVDREALRRYIWLSGATRRYEVASNTTVVSDLEILSTGGDLENHANDWNVTIREISENTRRSSRALHNTLIAIFLSQGPLDLLTSEPLSSPEPDGEERWRLSPLSKGGIVYETEQEVPARLRTAGQLLVGTGRGRNLSRIGFSAAVSSRLDQPELFGADIEDCLRSQLLPPSAVVLSRPNPREIISQRSDTLLRLLEGKVFGDW